LVTLPRNRWPAVQGSVVIQLYASERTPSVNRALRWRVKRMSRILKANFSWSQTRAKFFQLIASLSVILLQLKLTKLKLEIRKSDFQRKKKIWTQINLQLTVKISLEF